MTMKKMLWMLVSVLVLLTACSRDDSGHSEPPASEPPASEVAAPTWRDALSDNQAFSVRLPEGYTLTGEEPGNDVVLSAQDERAFMRIQLFDDGAQSAEYLLRNTPQTLAAVTEDADVQQLSAAPVRIANSSEMTAWRVAHPDGNVLAIIFRQNHHWVRLMLFNHGDSEAVFLSIAATVRAQTPKEEILPQAAA